MERGWRVWTGWVVYEVDWVVPYVGKMGNELQMIKRQNDRGGGEALMLKHPTLRCFSFFLFFFSSAAMQLHNWSKNQN